MHDVVRGSMWTTYSICYIIDGHMPVIMTDLFRMLHCRFSWHLCRTTRTLTASDALPSLVKLLDPIEHISMRNSCHHTQDSFHDELLLWTVLWTTKNAQPHAVLLMYTHATHPPSCSGFHWLIVYLSDWTQPLRQAYICCHLLTNSECIMYKRYQGNGHLRLALINCLINTFIKSTACTRKHENVWQIPMKIVYYILRKKIHDFPWST